MPDDLLQPPHPGRHRAMLESYGFGLFPVPAYRDATVGEWRMARYGAGPVEGYVSGLVMEPCRHVLHQGRTAWMSTSLMEQESHAFHVHQARGVVVVAGLGMAMYAHAVSLKPEVERVVVVEQAPEVIAVMREAAGLADWAGREKVTILQADALGPELPAQVKAATGGRHADYLYADIWPVCGASEAPAQTAGMVRALGPEAAGWWGQELSFGMWCQDRERAPDEGSLRAYAAETGVPIPVTAGYAAFCRDVIAARLPRRRWPGWSQLWRMAWPARRS
ncbi:MAG TPA: hypothetical protein VHL31_18865 [Geminicoccus sp.]|uniref:hypothetical protein n=1 Tax=Geminicoccus sp. TaxID=2024832 RepID=UPI002E30C513|nr:hypothetical protein [Geminicoccus sp.]HEX2528349.1 hypothetical protein [Geminicoccus sp.]